MLPLPQGLVASPDWFGHGVSQILVSTVTLVGSGWYEALGSTDHGFGYDLSGQVQSVTTWINCGNSTAVDALHQRGAVQDV